MVLRATENHVLVGSTQLEYDTWRGPQDGRKGRGMLKQKTVGSKMKLALSVLRLIQSGGVRVLDWMKYCSMLFQV